MNRIFSIISLILLLYGASFAQIIPQKGKTPKDTIVTIAKTEILRYIDSQEKELNEARIRLEGQRQLLMIMPDSILIRKQR